MSERIDNKFKLSSRGSALGYCPGWRGFGVGLLIVFLLSAVPGALSAGDAGQTDQVLSSGEYGGETSNQQVIAPGKVHLTLTRDGRWLDFMPSWNDGRSLLSIGGFFVFAEGPDGRMVEVANTVTGEIHVSENATRIRKCCEGTRGGFRAPSPDADDDRDGRVDEDRLDGIDNDNDGLIDEDFAAIGDEMVATCYFTPKIRETGVQLAFHQEVYAWSLPHIDGTVMVSLRIKNIGEKALENVRIGAFLEKEGPFYFSKWVLSLPDGRASALVCEDLYGTNVGLVLNPGGGSDPGMWSGGYVEAPTNASAVVLERLNDPALEALLGKGAPKFESEGSVSSSNASVLKSSEIRVNENALIYGLSPGLGSLVPGVEFRVDLALFAVAVKTELEASVLNTFKTYTGDGTNHYLPPPVSMTPRTLWGSYRRIDENDAGLVRVVVEIEAFGDDPVTADEISYISGTDPSTVTWKEVEPGVEQLILSGEAVQKSARKGERIVLKGRLKDGEFFEAILRPEADAGRTVALGEDAELFWRTPGRLEQDLLSSSPNPFRDATTIYYEIPALIEEEDGTRLETSGVLDISVKVYNVRGRLVNMLVENVVGPGVYSTGWQAVDEHGNAVASGVYYVRLQIGKKYLTERLILLK